MDFDNDDGSGRFAQYTLVGFKVSEIVKGLPAHTRHVWIDPGSMTSCYAEYRWGKEYLVFASGPVTVANSAMYQTLLPKEFQSAPSPVVYVAAECSGTRQTGYPGFDQDIELLRQYASGKPVPPLLGQVFITPYEWTQGGRRPGVQITLPVGNEIWRTQTNADGNSILRNRRRQEIIRSQQVIPARSPHTLRFS